MISLLKSVAWRLRCYFFLTCITYMGVTVFLWALMLTPLYLISSRVYRKAITWKLYLCAPGFWCVPYSWCRNKVYVSGLGRMKAMMGKDQMLVGNHSSRIDWLPTTYAGLYYGQRVGYVTEAFLQYLPFLGWHRALVEDMFVYRSFKRDKERLQKNIRTFKEDGVPRWVFLCPEGHIADFNATDKKYIADCEKFCKEQGFESYKMVLTPRYKGMQCFSEMLPEPKDPNSDSRVCLAGTLTYIQNGERLVKPLRSPDRVIPDLWSVVNMDLTCYINLHAFDLSNDPAKVKKELMTEYAFKDKLLQEFYETGSFPSAYPGKSIADSPDYWKPLPDWDLPLLPKKGLLQKTTNSRLKSASINSPESENADDMKYGTDESLDYYQEVPSMHLEMNLSLFGQVAFMYWLLSLVGLSHMFLPGFGVLYIVVTCTHFVGSVLANGQSRESLPFEGILKALMLRWYGIEGKNQKALDLGGDRTSKAKESQD